MPLILAVLMNEKVDVNGVAVASCICIVYGFIAVSPFAATQAVLFTFVNKATTGCSLALN